MDIDDDLIVCPLCIYSAKTKSNLLKHMELKHHLHESCNIRKYEALLKDKSKEEKQNTISKSSTNKYKPGTCEDCGKVFSRGTYLIKHMSVCKKKKVLDPSICEYCNKCFSDPCNKYRHLKICKKKKEIDQQALVPVNTNQKGGEEGATPLCNNITNNIQTQNNNQTTNIQNQQNNNVNIIVFDPRNTEFLTDHINLEKIAKLIARDTRRPEDRQEPRSIISTYSRDLLERPENKCIQKKNLRANYAKVHMGDNKWKSMLDQDVYPKLACNIANTFQTFLHSRTGDVKQNIRMYIRDRMIPFLDYMAEHGYCNHEERSQQVMEQFNALVQELRLVTFDLTVENGE